MAKITPKQMLTLGLQKGYGGETEFVQKDRAGFSVSVSHFEDPAGADGQPAVYHDEWVADRAGGGQELVRVGEQQYTRVYAGGTISYEAMASLGITKQDVIAFLVKMIQQLGGATRLHESCAPVVDGDWEYAYEVKESLPTIPMTVGKESIKFKGEVVFVHYFLLTEVG